MERPQSAGEALHPNSRIVQVSMILFLQRKFGNGNSSTVRGLSLVSLLAKSQHRYSKNDNQSQIVYLGEIILIICKYFNF